MRGFYSIGCETPQEQSPCGYANAKFTSAVSPALTRFWNQEEDDFYDDEDEEREWCD